MSFSPDEDEDAEQQPKPPTPLVAYGFIEICVAIYAYVFFGFATDEGASKLHDILAPSAFQVWRGHWWGLLGAAFVHLSFFHLLFNMWWVKDFGRLLEPRLGALKFTLFSVLAAIIGSGAQLAFSNQTGIGFSGVVYAYFGYLFAARESDPAYSAFMNPQTIRWMFGWFIFCIIATAAGVWNVANYAHAGGLAFGWLVGTAFVQRRYAAVCSAGVLLLLALTTVAVTWMPWSFQFRNRDRLAPMAVPIAAAQNGDPQGQVVYGTFLLDNPETEAEGLAWLQKAADSEEPSAFNNLAWRYATAPKATDRNGFEALRLAEKANQLTDHGSATFLDTLAAAHAELGEWEKAVEVQKQALGKLKPEQTKERTDLEGRLRAYENRKRVYEIAP
jgi:GlpG protein